MRERVGLCEISNFAKYSVTGAGAAQWLDRMLACKLPKPGRMTIAPMLKDDGRLIGDFTLANLGDEGWFIAGSGIAEQYHMRWFEKHLPGDGSVAVEALGVKLCGLSIAGPMARQLLAKVTRDRHVERGVSVHGYPPHGHRHGAVPGRPRQLHRRSRLRDLGGAGIPAPCLRDVDEGRRGIRHRPVRLARAQRAQAGEELWLVGARIQADLRSARSRARPLRRLCQGGRFHRQGGGGWPSANPAANCGCAPSSSRPTMPT